MILPKRVQTETLRDGSAPVLETDRLVLRAPRFEDVEALTELVNDRRIAENTARIPHPYRPVDAEEWIGRANLRSGQETFLITLREGHLAGACGFAPCEPSGREIGYWLGLAFWGRGYASEAVRALVDHAFEDGECSALFAGARVTNPASRRVLEKCGFEWTGVGLGRIHALNYSVPIDRFQLDRDVWAARKAGVRCSACSQTTSVTPNP